MLWKFAMAQPHKNLYLLRRDRGFQRLLALGLLSAAQIDSIKQHDIVEKRCDR